MDYNLALKWNAVVQPWTKYADISNKPSNPTREPGNEYDYTFIWWSKDDTENVIDPATEVINDIIVYKAVYEQTLRKYKVTFKDENDTVLKETESYEYWTVPSYNGQTPTKTATAQYTYTFAGWSDGTTTYGVNEPLPAVSWETTYTAVYSSTVNKYTITFNNEDGTLLQSGEVEYGATPNYDWVTPTKAADAQYTYTFAGWTPELVAVTWETTYTATYTSSNRSYEITLDPNGWEVNPTTKEVTVGGYYVDLPDPTRDGYTFAGWYDSSDTAFEHEITSSTPVTASASNQTLVAKWNTVSYNISYYDQDGTTQLTISDAPATSTVETIITIPNPEDRPWISFIWWKEYLGDSQDYTVYLAGENSTDIPAWKIWNRKYVAQWNDNGSVVVWLDWNDKVLSLNTEVPSGTKASELENIPTSLSREADNTYTYTFAGWTLDGQDTILDLSQVEVSGVLLKLKAKYTSAYIDYTVNFVNWNDDQLTTKPDYHYGDILTTKPSQNPTRADSQDGQYGYTFAGWSDGTTTYGVNESLPTVEWNTTYKAVYTENVKQYKITFVDEDGRVIKVDNSDENDYREYDYGTDARLIERPANPTKTDSENHYDYRFAGWTPELVAVTADKTYTASYSQTPKTYTITFYSDNNILSTKDVTFGSTYWDLPAPTKDGYDFMWWYTQSNGQWTKIESTTLVDSNIQGQILYAHWEIESYDIKYLDEDGNAVEVSAPDHYTVNDSITIPNPSKWAWYTFIWWKECTSHGVCQKAYLAEWDSITIPAWNTWDREFVALWNIAWFVVVWTNYDDVVLEIDTNVAPTTIPTYNGSIPQKADSTDGQYRYRFAGWTPAVAPIEATTTYKAEYNEVVRKDTQ